MKRHTISEIIGIMRQIGSSGLNISLACETHNITRMTYYRWLKKFPTLATASLAKADPLELESRFESTNPFEVENVRLKILVAEQALDIQHLKQMISGNGKPSRETAGSSDGMSELRLIR